MFLFKNTLRIKTVGVLIFVCSWKAQDLFGYVFGGCCCCNMCGVSSRHYQPLVGKQLNKSDVSSKVINFD